AACFLSGACEVTAGGAAVVGGAGAAAAPEAQQIENELAPAAENTVASAAEAEACTVTQNATNGNNFRDEVADLFRQNGYDVRTEVYKPTFFGPRRIDIDVWRDGLNLGGIET